MRKLALLVLVFGTVSVWAAKPELIRLVGLETVPVPLVDGRDCTHAEPSFTEGAWVLNVSVTPAAGKRLRDYTRTHVGGRMGFYIQGEEPRTPQIMDPIEVDGFLVGTFTRERAEELAKKINE